MLATAGLAVPNGEGALLGALLDVRYAPGQLEARLGSLIESLDEDELPSGTTLADALIVIAAVDVAKLDGIPREVLARFGGIRESDFRVAIGKRLAGEAVSSSSANMVHGRHRKISRSLLTISLESSDLPVEHDLGLLVDSVVDLGEAHGYRPGIRCSLRSRAASQQGRRA